MAGDADDRALPPTVARALSADLAGWRRSQERAKKIAAARFERDVSVYLEALRRARQDELPERPPPRQASHRKAEACDVGLYLLTFRLLFDSSASTRTRPDPRVKLPKQVREEPNPPTGRARRSDPRAIGAKWRLLFVTVEQGALRLGEAVVLTWADVDAASLRLRLPRSATKRDQRGGCTCPSG